MKQLKTYPMKQLATLSRIPEFKYDWSTIDDENQRIIAKSCVTGYSKKFQDLQRKAGKLIREDMHAKALCVHNLKTHLDHGLFVSVCAEALGLNKDTAAALADIGKRAHEGWLNGDILEMVKQMEPRAASKLLKADDEIKNRHVATFKATGSVPSRRSLSAPANPVKASETPTELALVSVPVAPAPRRQTKSTDEALKILRENKVRTLDICHALSQILRHHETVSSQGYDALRELKM